MEDQENLLVVRGLPRDTENILVYTGKRTSQANQEGENCSFIFIVCVKSVLRYHFKLAYVILQMAVKEIFETHL